MIRTRSFAAAVVVVGAGTMGALAAAWDTSMFVGSQAAGLGFAEVSEQTYSASVPDPVTQSKEERIAVLSQKIAKQDISPTVTETPTPVIPTEEDEALAPVLAEELRCGAYAPYSPVWSSRGIKLAEAEGVRMVYREVAASGSTTVSQREVLATLPIRSAPSQEKHCLSSDVIGISMNGALIRNSEARAYATFGSDVLIGYALDGFPIYGGLKDTPDSCGGATEYGQYRYGLSSSKNRILDCFSAAPITL